MSAGVEVTLPHFRRYPEYKDSGAEWLGKIPAHWEVKRLKNAVDMNKSVLPEMAPADLAIRYVDISGVDSLGRVVATEDMVFSKAPSRARRLAAVGDTVLSTVRTYLRAIAQVPEGTQDLVFSTGFAILHPRPPIDPRFFWRAAQGEPFIQQVVGNSEGVGYPAISPNKLATLTVALPPPEEQRIIATFLDHETASIDALVAKKERLIELLQEKRTALITRAVTKGLDPNAPMKDSGVEWLGEIPAHWSLLPLGQALTRITYGFTNPMPIADDGPHMVTANDIGDGEILFETARRTMGNAFAHDLTDKSRPRAGDILVTKDGTLGRIAVADGRPLCINQSVALLRVDANRASADFVQNALRASAYQERMTVEAGGTAIKHIYVSRLRKMPVAFPPVDEQERVCGFVTERRGRIDGLILRIRDAIDRLKELRTSLISAAVTGKIDVRGEAT